MYVGLQADAVLKYSLLSSNNIFINDELYDFVIPHRRPEGRPTKTLFNSVCRCDLRG